MKNLLSLFLLFLSLISCNRKKEQIGSKETHPILIKITYHPSFHQPAETILNLNEKYLLFYNPKENVVEPPAPPMENGEESKEQIQYKKYLEDRPELVPFKVTLNEEDSNSIRNSISTFNDTDFNVEENLTAIDGMSTNMIILFSDGKLIQMNPVNQPNEKQRTLYHGVLNILMAKNTNKNNAIILQNIENYK